MEIIVKEFSAENLADFRDLNVEWLQKYFVVEEHDEEQLGRPEAIIENGGKIFFASENGKNIGTASLIKEDDATFELAKMAVTEDAKGKGVGNLLMAHCIAEAEKLGAKKIILLSNRSLGAAIHLYEKYGFVEVPITNNPYARGNIKMEKILG